MEFLTDAIGSILGGGATGLLGTLMTAWVSYKKVKEDNRHKEAMAKQEHANIMAEAQANLEQARTEGEIQQALADTKAAAEGLAASYGHDQRRYATGKLGWFARGWMVAVDVARGFMRPAITTYLVVLTSLMYWQMIELLEGLEGAFSGGDMLKIVMHVTLTVLYLTATCVSWWFGGRQLEKYGVLQKTT